MLPKVMRASGGPCGELFVEKRAATVEYLLTRMHSAHDAIAACTQSRTARFTVSIEEFEIRVRRLRVRE